MDEEWEGEGERSYRERDRDGPPAGPRPMEGFDYLYGISPVLNALVSDRRKIAEIFVQEGMKLSEKKDKASVARILKVAEEMGVSKTITDKHHLNLLSDNRPHQGFILRTKPLEFVELTDTLPSSPPQQQEHPNEDGENTDTHTHAKTHPHWLALDEVWDPQNFGALLRSAHFLGMSGVVVCAKNSASLSPTVSKASAGALELMPVYSVKNMVKFLEKCKEKGYAVMGTSLETGSLPLAEVVIDKPTILVLGNEGHGVRTNVARACDVQVRIEGGEKGGEVDSLNVSVTGGILMHFLASQSSKGKKE